MKDILYYTIILLAAVFIFTSCEKFFDPGQELITESEDMFSNWEEYRSAEMGLYSLQQNLVDQIVILGELRGDLLKVTDYATPDLLEVYNFNIRKGNPYASPVNFYKLIIACNALIQKLHVAHPEVLDKNSNVTNYDRLYGEALCMRAWAYFNAVRIYGEVPYIHESLNSVEEIESYVNSPAEFTDSIFIKFAPDGFYNDTIRDTTIILERKILDQRSIIDSLTNDLEYGIKAVGVNHSINNNDVTWQATVWSDYARHVLLGQLYLFDQNYSSAMEHFDRILYNYDSETSNIKFGLDNRFQKNNWKNILTGIDTYEHIYSLWFNKPYKQTNSLQNLFSILPPNKYMLKPSASCIRYWESIWDNPVYDLDFSNPSNSEVEEPGIPGDFYRGYGISYKYYKDGEELSQDTIQSMLLKKLAGNNIDVEILMNKVDTVVTKYSVGKSPFDHDAHFMVFRAAGVHLYAAEIYAVWSHIYSGLTVPTTNSNKCLNILNDGSYNSNHMQLGVRGRVGFADNNYESIQAYNVVYEHDPVTNEIIGYHNYSNDIEKKRQYLVEKVMEERAREMAFEGERFYDLVRIAKRRSDPSFLADKVAAKFNGEQKEIIRELLLDENNWYIDFY